MWPFIVTFAIIFLVVLLLSLHTKLVDVLRDFASTEHAPLHPPNCRTNADQHALADHTPSRTMLFRERPILEDLSPPADDAWEQTLLTRKGGFLWVELNETSNEAWGISMFHALHCLKMLRIVVRSSEMMKSVVEKSGGASDNGGQDGGNFEHPDMNPLHIGHCVAYIAQVRGSFHCVRMIFLADMWCISIFYALQTVPSSHLGSNTIM